MTLPLSPERDIDPNVRQRRAANPDHSAWVSASAGSGKTKVLTDRMLRLMLPRADGRAGSRPEKILAITFTKAGANEMSLRLTRRLSKWVTLSAEKLSEELQDLLGRTPTKEDRIAAQRLFAQVTETPGGLKIMTIHAFCQSVLGRFPLEAGISPHFKPLEESQQQEWLTRARESVLAQAAAEKTSPLALSVERLAMVLDEDSFSKRLLDVLSERRQLANLKSRHFGIDGLYTALCQSMNVLPGQTEEDITRAACTDGTFDEDGLRRAVKALSGGTPATDIPKSMTIQTWIDATPDRRLAMMDDYVSSFLTKEGDVRKTLATAAPVKACPDLLDVLSREAGRLATLKESRRAAQTCLLTADLLRVGDAVLSAYQDMKRRRSLLDFDDLILTTLDLLTGRTMSARAQDVTPWVMFKLDRGIDHILVDEAQDTNPEQWEIIQTLCLEFFEGLSAQDDDRTVFVVGDEKQSIFGFQRAAPEKMAEMKSWFSKKIAAAEKSLEIMPLNISFRTVPVVLEVVDAVMNIPRIRGGLGAEVLPHLPYRRGQAGRVELWPLFKPDAESDEDFLSPPVSVTTRQSGAEKMAAYMARTIAGWIGKETLPSRNRTVRPGDILILMRTRNRFVETLVRALKRLNVPVSGVDRMVLSDQLVTQDLINLARAALLPTDDLSLAAVLTSPFVGWKDDTLFALAHGRGEKSLWAALSEQVAHKNISAWLKDLSRRAGRDAPYEFFMHVLNTSCPADGISGLRAMTARLGADMRDPLDEFLNAAINFERNQSPSLSLFIESQSRSDQDIKRELEEAGGAVRIMTIHGAKGLQAPIVILPDTIRSKGGAPMDRVLWPAKTHGPLPLFIPSKDNAPAAARDVLAQHEAQQAAESARLLYVAMTRAEDRLYIGGYQGQKAPADESWYYALRDGMESIPGVLKETFPDIPDETCYVLSAPQDKAADKDKTNAPDKDIPAIDAPSWIFESAPVEPTPPRPMTPSRPSMPDAPVASPLNALDKARFIRGNVTHKLLQILPDLPRAKWTTAATSYVAHPAHALPAAVKDSIVQEVLAVLTHPDYAPLFGAGSMAEVPVTGFIAPDRLISGQIDRLVVRDHDVLILDYKTNRPAPRCLDDVPTLYRHQMESYARALLSIYPERRIRLFLLWTEDARIMELPFSAP